MLLAEVVAAADPAAPALVDGDRTWSFGRLAAEIDRVAAAVARLSDPGDRIAVVGRNRAEYVALLYGIPTAGRIAVPLNQRLAPVEQQAQLARAGAALLVGDDPGGPTPAVAWSDWEAWLDDGPPPTPGPRPDPDDGAWLLFTSGTTGAAKGAVLTHRSLLTAVAGANAARPVAPDDVYLFPFPLCHVAAYNVVCQHRQGRPLVLMAGFDAVGLQDECRRHAVTALSLAPTMLAMLLDHDGFDPEALATVRQIAYGASAMPPALLARAVDALGVGFAQGYGMTELSGNAVFLDEAGHRAALGDAPHLLRAAGRPSPLAEVRIADGEILVRGGQVMAGYWEDPEATARVLVDGWLHTGDLGRIDDDGYLYVVDRAKDIVVTGGENVASREVEDVLSTHPAVAQVAVVGVPDDRWGEAVCAVVVPRAGATVDLEGLVAHTRGVLAGFKQPRRLVVVDALPVNASGKVLKRDLRDQVAARP